MKHAYIRPALRGRVSRYRGIRPDTFAGTVAIVALLLSSCAEPLEPDSETSITSVRPEPSLDAGQVRGRAFGLTSLSRIEIKPAEPNRAPPVRFSRFAGRIVADGEALADGGHNVTVDTVSMESPATTAVLDRLKDPTGFSSKMHPNFVIAFYEVGDPDEGYSESQFRVQIGDATFQSSTRLRIEVDEDALVLATSIPLALREQFGAKSSLIAHFGDEAILDLELTANALSKKASIIQLGETTGSPASHRTGRRNFRKTEGIRFSKGARLESAKTRNLNLFEALDVDGDGRVSKTEAGERWSAIASSDRNGDGFLSREEIGTLRRRVTPPTSAESPTSASENDDAESGGPTARGPAPEE
ncbi:MAG: hypothetical protein WD342_17925 [Verrucomicrobiales bacterium]